MPVPNRRTGPEAREPIAASLVYANKEKNLDLKNSQWIVDDLGGGMFDVALVKIVESELKILDHEGDNLSGRGRLRCAHCRETRRSAA